MTSTSLDPAPTDTLRDGRRLVTRERVMGLAPIDGADRIEAARVRGWTVVVEKGAFAVGDEVVYFEIDAMLPLSDERFAFLAQRSARTVTDAQGVERDVHVLRTARLRGTYSQGLILPLTDFPEIAGGTERDVDVAEALGVLKWDPPLPPGTEAAGPFPPFLSKTSAERIENIDPALWRDLVADREGWVAVEKVDGWSLTAWKDHDGTLHVAGRRWELHRHGRVAGDGDETPYDAAVRAARLDDRLAPGQWVQGEVAGPGVRKNPLRLSGVRLFVFGFGTYASDAPGASGSRAAFADWPAWATGIAAPRLAWVLPADIDEVGGQVESMKSAVTPSAAAEGVVWTRDDGRDIAALNFRHVFKAISPRYLLKHS